MTKVVLGSKKYLKTLMLHRGPIIERLEAVTKFRCNIGPGGLTVGDRHSYDIALLPSLSLRSNVVGCVSAEVLRYLQSLSDYDIIPVFFGTNRQRNSVLLNCDISFIDMAGNFCLPMFGIKGYHKSSGCSGSSMPTSPQHITYGFIGTVLDYLCSVGGVAKAKDIVEACGDNCAVHRSLRRLEDAGVVIRSSRGCYALSPHYRGGENNAHRLA